LASFELGKLKLVAFGLLGIPVFDFEPPLALLVGFSGALI
jgi:hypothetical protein